MLEQIGDNNVARKSHASAQSPDVELETNSRLSTQVDNAAVQALPQVDLTWSNSFQFAQSLQRNFELMDLNSDGKLNKLDLEPRLNANAKTPQHPELYKLAKTLDNNYTQLSSIISGPRQEFSGVTLDHVKKMMEFGSPANCENGPSFGGTMTRSVAGGVIGGGVAAKMSGDKFSDGAGTGAAVGAVVGLLAYGVQSAQYQEFKRNRETFDSFGEFKNETCSTQSPLPIEQLARNDVAAGDTGFDRMRENTKIVNDTAWDLSSKHYGRKPNLSETEMLKRLESLKSHYSAIDADKDGALSYTELAEAVRSKRFSSLDTATAAIVARNIDAFSRISEDGTSSGSKIEMADFDKAKKIFEPGDNSYRNAMTAMSGSTGAIIGCGVGGLIGLFSTAGTFSVPACIGGAALMGGGTGLFQYAITPKDDPFGRRIGQERANNLRTELSWMH